ncbi:UDP-glucose 4-epimerase [Aureobasidium subglaciale]|nr:UDP-glucose 4-epimerase [Aureobasidium subglaciale]KAI5220327.1 UDP-glucose 4-epimerase [Aureobasidium subglaciale]KAI5222906.1 UDP-glucose 4-epimerase [Aureobasidium subglaciale]KAI5260143.1 UDP-glucose 4-epimerase [Aureobasidium subglaciale]
MPSHNRPVEDSIQKKAERFREEIKSFSVCLVTGGAGYIGSHTVLELLNVGVAAVVIDNLCNSHVESLCRVHYIARTEARRLDQARIVPPIFFHQVDIRDTKAMNQVFEFWQSDKIHAERTVFPVSIGEVSANKAYPMLEYVLNPAKRAQPSPQVKEPSNCGKITAVIHFAALKAVGESITKPLEYYENNVAALVVLLKAMKRHDVGVLIFSSSAVVYGVGHEAGITEDTVQVAGKGSGGGLLTNPYGRSKWMSEEIINDYCIADPNFYAISLRYFNPTGSHPSGLIGEDPKGTPNNIVPVILQAYQRRRSRVHVFGSNYDTSDGTGVRDYIHVNDLAMGHLAALRKATKQPDSGPEGEEVDGQDPASNYNVYNLGTGRGYSVLEIINAFSNAAGASIPFTVGEARAGDLGTVTASPDKAASDLDWRAEFDLQDMCRDVFNWAAANPTGYETLRRLSTMSGMNSQDMRRQSVATGLFDREEDFDNFISTSLNSIDKDSTSRRMSSHGSNFSNLLKKMRSASIASHGSASDDSESLFQNNYALSSSPGPGSGIVPRFSMAWEGDPSKTPRTMNDSIAEGVEDGEEEGLDLEPTLSPSTSRTLPTRFK